MGGCLDRGTAYTKAGVVGGVMLGLGRALGETMAVTFVIGNFNQLSSLSLFLRRVTPSRRHSPMNSARPRRACIRPR